MLVRTESPPLREIATVLMKVSQNLYAETLLKAAGGTAGGTGTAAGGPRPRCSRRSASGRLTRRRWSWPTVRACRATTT